MAPPTKPKPQKIKYFFCRNPQCSYHATVLATDTSGLQSGSPCPVSKDPLDVIEVTSTAPVLTDDPTGAAGKAVVLPPAPYGGFRLMISDADDTSTFEGAAQSDPRHAGARYVAELQRDLLRLAFYGPARGGETLGKFSLQLMACVLDLKKHLRDQYLVRTSDDLTAVNAAAKNGLGPIHFRRLLSPAQVYGRFAGWQKILDGSPTPQRPAVAIDVRLAQFARDWEDPKRKENLDDDAAIDAAETAKTITKQKAKDARTRLGRRDQAYGIMSAAWKTIAFEARQATGIANNLAARPPQSFNFKLPASNVDLKSVKTQALSTADRWLKIDPDLKKTGIIDKLDRMADAFEKDWTAPTDPAKAAIPLPIEFEDFRSSIVDMRPAIQGFRDAINASDASTLFDSFRQELREFGAVDAGTARHIREALTTGALNGREVFFTPADNEVVGLGGAPIRTIIAGFVDAAKITSGGKLRTKDNVPLDLLEYIFAHESGTAQAKDFAGRKFATLGIDWDATDGVRDIFRENTIRPDSLSFSRGWGATQKTLFSVASFTGLDLGTNTQRTYQLVAGVPYVPFGQKPRPLPEVIASALGNVRAGVELFVRNFDVTTKRDCTFSTPYDCKSCVKSFNMVVQTEVKGGAKVALRKGPSILFDAATNEFVQLRPPKVANTYGIADHARMEALVRAGTHTIPGLSPPLPAAATTEFPCSWITAIMRYAGGGDQAYFYGQEGIWTLKGKPVPP